MMKFGRLLLRRSRSLGRGRAEFFYQDCMLSIHFPWVRIVTTYLSINHNTSVAKSCDDGGCYKKFVHEVVAWSESFPKPFASAKWTRVPFLIRSSGQKCVGSACDNRGHTHLTFNSQTLVASDPVEDLLTSGNSVVN